MEKQGKRIIIAERDNIAAIMQGKKVTEFFVHRGQVLLGDIYLATVENILPSIEAAFVDVGVDRMGFLHAQDIMGKGALKDKISPKQKLVVQVVKEPTGHKGPRVTTEISLPGRFLVLIPNETGINVSRKIESVKEKARLKSVVSLLKPVGVGVIVRTEAEGQLDTDIQEDLEVLLEKWNNIVTAADSLTPPSLISRDQDLLYRVLREACTDDISEIVVDTAFAMNRVQQLLQNWRMSSNIQVSLYKGSEPLLIATDVHKEIKAALQTKVMLPCGGYLYIQTTEALTVVDVNSGKFISSATQDETILRTNKEAIHEIARQLRLRNIGGMIIIDFIDMTSRVDKLAILEEFEIAIEPDKSKPQIGQLSDLGLVELTRHRQGQSLSELFTKKCPHCQGNGYVMEDFKFASSTTDGEYRAKAAKMKLSGGGFKKNNNHFKKDFNKQRKQQEEQKIGQPTIVQPIKQNFGQSDTKTESASEINSNIVNNSQQIIQQETMSGQEHRTHGNNNAINNSRNKFNRNNSRENFSKENKTQVADIQQNIEQKVEFKPELKSEASIKVDIQPIVKGEVKEEKVSVKKSKVKEVTAKVDVEVKEKTEKVEKPKKVTRRPNRNTSKKVAVAKSEVTNEEIPEQKD